MRYRWDRSVNRTELQLYLASPLAWDDAGSGPGPGPGPPLPAFREVLEAGEGSDGGGGGGGDPAAAAAVSGIDVLGAGTVRLDFGTELAGWFEFELEVGEEAGGEVEVEEVVLRHLTCALSEFGAPLPEKAARPVRYGASSYRLETNDGLYEGVRYVFLTYAPSWHRGQEEGGEGLPLFRIVRPRVVAQVRPVAYSATYGEADAALAKIWYSAAYGVRLNMHAHDFGTGEHICMLVSPNPPGGGGGGEGSCLPLPWAFCSFLCRRPRTDDLAAASPPFPPSPSLSRLALLEQC